MVKGSNSSLSSLFENLDSGTGRLSSARENAVYLVYLALILPHLGIAGTAIYRSTLLGFEGYFSLFAALSANSREFLHGASGPAAFFGFPGLTTGETPLRFVSVTFLLEKLLLSRGESKFLATINTLDLFVRKRH